MEMVQFCQWVFVAWNWSLSIADFFLGRQPKKRINNTMNKTTGSNRRQGALEFCDKYLGHWTQHAHPGIDQYKFVYRHQTSKWTKSSLKFHNLMGLGPPVCLIWGWILRSLSGFSRWRCCIADWVMVQPILRRNTWTKWRKICRVWAEVLGLPRSAGSPADDCPFVVFQVSATLTREHFMYCSCLNKRTEQKKGDSMNEIMHVWWKPSPWIVG